METIALVSGWGCTFCQQTHKPGLCAGQHRGGTEPNTPVGDRARVHQATAAIANLNANLRRLQQQMITATDPKQKAMIQRAIGDYRKQLQPHLRAVREEAAKERRAQAQAASDSKQQDTLDKQAKAKAAKKRSSGTTLKPYQTSTKI